MPKNWQGIWWGAFLLVLFASLIAMGTGEEALALAHGDKVSHPEPELAGGPVRENLPWEGDTAFLKALDKYKPQYLLGAFRTVLPDPLPGEEYNVEHAARLLTGTVVLPGEIFSQNRKLGPYEASRGYLKGPTYLGTSVVQTEGGGVCKIATTLYNVVKLADLKVVERHTHSMTVPYVPAGQDATVSYGNRDFRFQNNSGAPILIWSHAADKVLHIGFYGNYQPPEITWRHHVLATNQPPLLYQNDPSLPKGQEELVNPGSEGVVVRSWLEKKAPDGTISTEQLGVARYSAMPRVIRRGTRWASPERTGSRLPA